MINLKSPKLTFNGVLYLSLGFKQYYSFQILTLRRGERKELQLVLYDGIAYIGARYLELSQTKGSSLMLQSQLLNDEQIPNETRSEPKQFDIVRIFPLAVTKNEPILIERLEILQTGLSSLLGTEVITLQEFMRRRSFSHKHTQINLGIDDQIEDHSRKIVKIIDEETVSKSNSHHNSSKKQKEPENQIDLDDPQIVLNKVSHEHSFHQQEDKSTQKMVIQHYSTRERESTLEMGRQDTIEFEQRIVNNDQQESKYFRTQQNMNDGSKKSDIALSISQEEDQFKMNRIINIDEEDDLLVIKPQSRAKEESTSMYIHDLYERMHRFRILCRVNHLSQFTSQRGTFCTKLFLIDEVGNEIICMLFEKIKQKSMTNHVKFVKGKSYVFQNGQVSRDEHGLNLSVPWSGVTQQHRFLPSFAPSKMHRLTEIEKESTFFIEKAINLQKDRQSIKKPQHINICGIFKGFKDEPKLAKNLFRVNGFLCDPNQELSIVFTLLVDELSSFPEEGAAVSLHNMHIVEDDQRTLRLQSTKKSYILNETGNAHEYFSDLLKSSVLKSWRMHDYRNLSEITYTSRTISELKVLLCRMLEHECAYSQIDCNIQSITEKRFYNSCITCKRETKPQSGIFTYCLNCRKQVKYTKRFLFDLEVSDATGSLVSSLTSDGLEGFINISAEEYGKHEKDDRVCYLELCTYQNIVMKVKSERVVGGVNHRAVAGSKFNQKRGLAQIRSLIIDEKVKYINSW